MTKSHNSLATSDPIHWFRHSVPYIHTHQGKTFVLMIDSDAVYHENFSRLIYDIAVLQSLGVRLVIIHGARGQIDDALATAGFDARLHRGVRVTTAAELPTVLATITQVRLTIEAELSKGLANTPLYGTHISTVTGNYISARPLGVVDGVDYELTGQVRRVDTDAINHHLNDKHVIIISPYGYSVTGEIFSLEAFDVAWRVAVALRADKLILFSPMMGIYEHGTLMREMTAEHASTLIDATSHPALINAIIACQQGVERVHIISHGHDGALIKELFTTDGLGTMITQAPYERIRAADSQDVVGIMALIAPLEAQGILVARSRQRLEEELNWFYVMERDGRIIGCAALYPLDKNSAEIASVAVHPDYRSGDRGVALLHYAEALCREQGRHQLFALTTQTLHWFIEQGFSQTTPDALPADRRARYDNGRNSKVLVKKV